VTRPDRTTTLAAVRSGVDAVLAQLDRVAPDAPTPCVRWDARQLARHLEAIAGAYLLWNGSAVGGRVARLRTATELARYNELMLQRLPRLTLADHRRRFLALACDHLRLAAATWDLPMVETPDGTPVEVGIHAGTAAVEWHVHAWDLARAADRDHTPPAEALRVVTRAWDTTLAQVTGVERDPDLPPWTSVLVASGRRP
jgi:uncharacterized protein (TIGR03083 family)